MSKLVLDIQDRRPYWAPPGWVAAEITAAVPSDWSVEAMTSPAEGTGDGQAGVAAQVLEAVRDAEVYIGFGISAAVLQAGPKLRWVHSGSAGVGGSLSAEMLKRQDLVFTNSAGVHGPPIAEAILGMLFYFFRGFDIAVQAAHHKQWSAPTYYGGRYEFPEFSQARIGILGLGGIGIELGRRAQALGATVVGLKRTPPTTNIPIPELELHVGLERLPEVLTTCHAVVTTLPDTHETRGLLDGPALSSMRRGAVLINVARGSLIDETALAELLRSGHLRGAGLDVFAEEPLPASSALWELPNVLLTPHVSPLSTLFWRRQTDLIQDNLHRYLRGASLCNVVNRSAGY